jgi:AcrR family transcriptional regulator
MSEDWSLIDDTAQRILEAAERVFAERGFRGATVREILEMAKVKNVAAVNYYFGSKENLYVTAVKFAYRHCVTKVPMPDWPDATPPEQKLRDFIEVVCRRVFLDERPWSHQLMMRELVEPTRACAEIVREYAHPLTDILRTILRELLPALSAEELFFYSCSILGQILIFRTHREFLRQLMGPEAFQQIDVNHLAQHVTNFSMAGILAAKRKQ